tara:strand:+ start:123 stop:248 length:126 start_codon:yes stop_codon:yes gene_type:complete
LHGGLSTEPRTAKGKKHPAQNDFKKDWRKQGPRRVDETSLV